MKNIISALALAGCMTITASAATVTLTGAFSGALEATPNASPGTGTVTVIVDDVLNTANVTMNYSGMLTAGLNAGVYCCQIPDLGVVLPKIIFLTPFTVGTSGSVSGTYGTTHANILSLEGGGGYINIITDGFSGGEIRANLAPASTPEPTTCAMIGLGLTALGLFKRRKQ